MRRQALRLARFHGLPRGERSLLTAAAAMLALARLGLRILGVPRTRRLVRRLAPGSLLPPVRVAELVRMACEALPGATLCLPRALVLEALLAEADHPAELRIGLAPDDGFGRRAAHAWVELRGVAVAEDPSRYTALPVFGARV